MSKLTCMVSTVQGRSFPISAEADEDVNGETMFTITFHDTGIMVSREEIAKVIEFFRVLQDETTD